MTYQFIDQMHENVSVTFPPQRIISLVPSQTELLHYLGLGARVVGITKFCTHPEEWHRDKLKIGGTKNLWFDKIDGLEPDLVIGNKEENNKEDILKLKEKYPVWMSDVNLISDANQLITAVGEITGTDEEAKELNRQINEAFSKIRKRSLRVLYLIWKKPFMVVGRNTFINAMLETAGFANVIAEDRYPELSPTAASLSPELIMLSTEPYPFTMEDASELKILFPKAKIMLVDGSMFSWYGSRLRLAPDYINSLDI